MWNLTRLAECLLPLAGKDDLVAGLEAFPSAFEQAMARNICRRLNLPPLGHDQDIELSSALFTFLHATKAPFERVFFDWFGGAVSEERARKSPLAAMYQSETFAAVRTRLAGYAPKNPERLAHAYFAGDAPCTLIVDEIETIWAAIADHDDWSLFEAKLMAIESMRQAIDI